MTPLCSNSLGKQGTPHLVLRRGVGAVIVFHLVFALFVLLRPHSHHLRAVVSDLFETGGGLLAAALCFLRPQRAARPEGPGAVLSAREAWLPRLFGAGLSCYAIGQGIYAFQHLVLHKITHGFSTCDLWYLASYPLLLAGIVWLPTQPLPASSRPRLVLDALMNTTALVTFSWYFLLGPILEQKHVSNSARFVALSYPTLDLAAIFCILMLGQHAMSRGLRRVAGVVSGGLALTVVADSIAGYQSLHHAMQDGTLLDLGLSLGYCAVALAVSAVRLFPEACRHEDDHALRPAMLWQSLLPYAFLPAVGMLLLCLRHANAAPRLALGSYMGASLLVVLVLLRQIMTIFENRALNARLASYYQDSVENLRRIQQLNDELVSTQGKLHDNVEALTRANNRLEHLADTDAVSGLRNHRGMVTALDEAQAQARQEGKPCALLFLDIDHFKALNDTFGHMAGDAALREVGLVLQERLRPVDTLGRWGGEEFLALLPGAGLEEAMLAAEAVQTGIATHEFAVAGGLRLTCSVGVAALPQHAPDWKGLVDAADRAMYVAKREGRNRVRAAFGQGEEGVLAPSGPGLLFGEIRPPTDRAETNQPDLAWNREQSETRPAPQNDETLLPRAA